MTKIAIRILQAVIPAGLLFSCAPLMPMSVAIHFFALRLGLAAPAAVELKPGVPIYLAPGESEAVRRAVKDLQRDLRCGTCSERNPR